MEKPYSTTDTSGKVQSPAPDLLAINRALGKAKFRLGLAGGNLMEVSAIAAAVMKCRLPASRKCRAKILLTFQNWVPPGRGPIEPLIPQDMLTKAGKPKKPKPARSVFDPPWVATPAFLRSAVWRRLRMRVLVARGNRCEACGASPEHGATICVDHVKPRIRFPELALEEGNLQILCGVCNHGKGNWDETDWRDPALRPRLAKR